MHIIVYTLPSCVQCDAVKRRLTTNAVPFVTADLSEPDYAERLEAFKAEGILQAPITVLVNDAGDVLDRVVGNDPGGITRLIEEVQG